MYDFLSSYVFYVYIYKIIYAYIYGLRRIIFKLIRLEYITYISRSCCRILFAGFEWLFE